MALGMIISPAKKMNVVEGPPYVRELPAFRDKTERLMSVVQGLSLDEAQHLWACSDRLAALNYERFAHMDLDRDTTAAVIAYEGIQYQHLAPAVMDEAALAYLGAHLRILSGFYGVVRPFDGVVPYRLEMQAKLAVDGCRNLYEYWGNDLAVALAHEFDLLINLASVEYAKAVVPHAEPLGLPVLTCLFGSVRKDGAFVQRATEAKAARGTFVRWCAEHQIEDASALAGFDERGYALDVTRSDDTTLVFVR